MFLLIIKLIIAKGRLEGVKKVIQKQVIPLPL